MTQSSPKLQSQQLSALEFVLSKSESPSDIDTLLSCLGVSPEQASSFVALPKLSQGAKWYIASLFEKNPSLFPLPYQQKTFKALINTKFISNIVNKTDVPYVEKAFSYWVASLDNQQTSQKDIEFSFTHLSHSPLLEHCVADNFAVFHQKYPNTTLTKKLPPHLLKKWAESNPPHLSLVEERLKSQKVQEHAQQAIKYLEGIRAQILRHDVKKAISDLRESAPSYIKSLATEPEVLALVKKSFDYKNYSLATSWACFPVDVIKKLDTPYSFFFAHPLNGNWGILQQAFEYELLDQKEQSKLLTTLLIKKVIGRYHDKVRFDQFLDFCIKNKVPTAPLSSLPSQHDVASSGYRPLEVSLKWGVASSLMYCRELTPSSLKKMSSFLKKIDKKCGIDPTIRGFLEYVYHKANTPFPLEGPTLYPKQNTKDPLLMDWMQDYNQYVLKGKLLKVTDKSKTVKPSASQRKM